MFLLLTAVLVVVFVPAMALGPVATNRVRRVWCRGTARILGPTLAASGQPFTDCPSV
jgi:hypothetical protein